MIIYLNDRWRLTSDAHQWILQRRAEPKEGKSEPKTPTWTNSGYYRYLHEAVTSCMQKQIRMEMPADLVVDHRGLEILSEWLTDIQIAITRATSKLSETLEDEHYRLGSELQSAKAAQARLSATNTELLRKLGEKREEIKRLSAGLVSSS